MNSLVWNKIIAQVWNESEMITENTLHLEKSYPQLFEFADKCQRVLHEAQTRIQQRNSSYGELTNFERIFILHLYKANESFMSSIKLASNGLCSDSSSICRKLFEQLVTLTYLQKDPILRAELYWDYSVISNRKSIRRRLKVEESEMWLQKKMMPILQYYDDQYEELKSKYGIGTDDKLHRRFMNSWSGKHLKDMAKECELEDDYVRHYESLSSEVHSSKESISRFMLFNPSSGVSFGSFSTLSEQLAVVLQATAFLISIIEVVREALSLDIKLRVDELICDLRELSDWYGEIAGDDTLLSEIAKRL